jgi:ribonuclease I
VAEHRGTIHGLWPAPPSRRDRRRERLGDRKLYEPAAAATVLKVVGVE